MFVEGHTRRGHNFGVPEKSISAAKRQHHIAAAQHYLQEQGVSLPLGASSWYRCEQIGEGAA